jgi:16S rRNA (guanine966-N2)-methyltransferase
MRIIAGKFRSRIIKTIDDRTVRPTTDRVRQTVFDVLNNRIEFDSIATLDLFAGSGILGFETLSRGGASVVFVEQHPQTATMIQSAAQSLKVEPAVEIVTLEVMRFLNQTTEHGNHERYDLIFADPPYKFSDYDAMLGILFSRALLVPEGYLVLEHHHTRDFSPHERFLLRKDFGVTAVSFFQMPGES